MLTKMGFGTAGYLGDIRCRGTPISTGGTSTGVLPVIEGFRKIWSMWHRHSKAGKLGRLLTNRSWRLR